ncbi:MAG TPA: hypothetical protein PLS71_11055 [Leptospiraceae bacterium]|nr:hypothetical protein [Leptospiraceae bacterium]
MEQVLSFYGGESLWQKSSKVEANVNVKGLAFTLKGRPFFQNAKIEMEINSPVSKITPIGKEESISGILEGDWVYLQNASGKKIAERKNPRSFFPFGRRLFYWDDLDMTYFANYAFWNYFTFPKLLLNSKIEWREKKESVLEGIFPADIPTHSKIQEFRFDNTGKLLQHNYTAEVISSLAKAANVIHEHGIKNGFPVPSKRIVSPQSLSGNAIGFPVLIDISVLEFNLK